MNVLDQLALAVTLHELDRDPKLAGNVVEAALDVAQCLGAVDRRLANAEQIEVRTVDDGEPHDFFSPSSQALNCWMSSLGPAFSAVEESGSEAATSCWACCE